MKKTFKLDKEREFLFDFQTACAFEEAYGDTIINSMQKIGPHVVKLMVWAAVRHNFQEKLPLASVPTMIQKFLDRRGDMQKLWKFLFDGWAEAGVVGQQHEEAKSLEDLEREALADPADEGKGEPGSAPGS